MTTNVVSDILPEAAMVNFSLVKLLPPLAYHMIWNMLTRQSTQAAGCHFLHFWWSSSIICKDDSGLFENAALFNHLFMSVWTHGYFYTLVNIVRILHYDTDIMSPLATGCFLIWPACLPGTQTPLWTFWHTWKHKMLQASIDYSLFSPSCMGKVLFIK